MFQQRRPRHTHSHHRSREEWLEIVEEYESCTLSQARFCAGRGVSATQLRHWRNRFIEESSAGGSFDAAADSADAPSDTLVDFLEFPMVAAPKAPVQAPEPTPLPAPSGDGHWRVELDLGGGLVLRVR